MPGFLQTLQSKSRVEAARVQEQDLRQWGLTGQWPRGNFRLRRPTLRDSPLPARDPAPGTVRRRRGWTVLWVFNPRTTGPSLLAPAVGLGGEEPRLGPGSRYPACAARGARGRGRNVFPGREARPARGPRHPARWPWGGGTS